MNIFIKIFKNYGIYGIIFAGFSESTFLPFPMETISLPIYLSNSKKAIFYSLCLISFSTIGSFFGYYIGKYLGSSVIKKTFPKKTMEKIKNLYDKNSFLAILSSAFTPIPYEAYVLSAGIFQINLKTFLLASFCSRFLRHFPQGVLIFFFGEAILKNLSTYMFFISTFFLLSFILISYFKKIKI